MTKADSGGSDPTTAERSVPNPPSPPGDPTSATPPRTYLVDGKRLPAHPAADLFPLMTGPDREALKTDLKDNGQRAPVYIDADRTVLVDGRNRCIECEALNIRVLFEILPPDTDLVSFITSQNLIRRHLETSLRALIAAGLANLRKGGDAGRPKTAPNASTAPPLPQEVGTAANPETSAPRADALPVRGGGRAVGGDPMGKLAAAQGKSRRSSNRTAEWPRPAGQTNGFSEPLLISQNEAAQMMGVSITTLKKAKCIIGDPILEPALRDGTISVHAAYTAKDADDETKRRLVAGERAAARTTAAGDCDWTTPEDIMSIVRRLLGGVDLDPASSIEAQKSIQAVRFLTPKDDALNPATSWGKPNEGLHVFLHPPRGDRAPRFASRLLQELKSGAVHKACWLGSAAFQELWFRSLVRESTAFVTLNEPLEKRASGTDLLICFRVPATDVHDAVGGRGVVSMLFRPPSLRAAGASRDSAQSMMPKAVRKEPPTTAK